ncbi:zinc finger, C2H2-like, Zinc finger, double-stranded RNA binding protein [Artemisia annua]|uniref:Zinc finger, C2H2-like, Zinc finger, double-stranded RNA binding protein n=1 Tax=Artemisia annua TaxID=35608 RepID=A0A2U1Q408_ARTAN|nr:zinc finger, C2H2-like, Zinc finger, double-stranded RNA binding protein [Artemisia annua]
MVDFEDSSTTMAVSVSTTECSSVGGNPTPPNPDTQPVKKKRNLPGMPDPEAEVIALSPTTLVATNRFVCEICNKGFQRDQNLQLHRRGHNLPWKLKQRDGKEIRKRVYVCPEVSCIHHDPSRALGDLTGIKKHFSRKHGEKKWKCERCSKKYAVQSDWKAHMKTCGTKEYRCDCGTLFSRRDSFITHRAFCDALAQESVRSQPQVETSVAPLTSSPPPQPLTPSTGVLSPVQSVHSSDVPEKALVISQQQNAAVVDTAETVDTTTVVTSVSGGGSTSSGNNAATNNTNNTGVFASIFASSSVMQSSQSSPASYSNMICGVTGADLNTAIEPMSLSLSSSLYRSSNVAPSLFPQQDQTLQPRYVQTQQPALSATALLQKAAQMGSASSNTSFLHALGLAPTSTPTTTDHYQEANIGHWSSMQSKQERNDNSSIGLMGPPATTTLDFLGLGTGGSSSGYSAFLSSIGGNSLNVAAAAAARVPFSVQNKDWDDSGDTKPPI